MKITIVGRKLNVYEDTRELIERKLAKLDKYFKSEAPRQRSHSVVSATSQAWR